MSATWNQIAADYVAAFRQDGSRAYVANLDTEVELLHWGDHALPLTINSSKDRGTFVCSPRTGFIDYTLEELARFPRPALVPPLRLVVGAVGATLSLADIDRIVHVNNWMTSTNLPVDLDPGLLADQTAALVARFPGHVLAIRSLTASHSAPLMQALLAQGWRLVPCRQIFLLPQAKRDGLRHRDSRRDQALWDQRRFAAETLTSLGPEDANRIAQLYRLLYLEKYSRLNPAYTPDFIGMTHRIGMIRYQVLRDAEGVIQGFGGIFHRGGHVTMPLIGYNTALPQTTGLYRMVFHAGTLFAAQHDLCLNMSSGAGTYKLNRGATAEIEYTAFHVRHLARHRRAAFRVLGVVADRIGVPLLKSYRL